MRTLAVLCWSIPIVSITALNDAFANVKCGQLYPAYSLNGGQTAAVTLKFGAPAALFTIGEPTLGGCNPAAGYYVYDNTKFPAQMKFSYAQGTGTKLPLINAVHSNVTVAASFNVTYEPQVKGHTIPVRPASVRVRDVELGEKVGHLTYDARGRLTFLNWTLSHWRGSKAAQVVRKSHQSVSVKAGAPLGFQPTPQGEGATIVSYEKYMYEDNDHPFQATYYEAVDDTGMSAGRYRWHTRPSDGLVTGVEVTENEKASCQPLCDSNATCCRQVGTANPGACFSVPSCERLGGKTWQYEYDALGRVKLLNESGIVQIYTYDDGGRIQTYLQGNKTLFEAQYDAEGHIQSQIFFVIYPLFPEVWAFDAPEKSADTILV